MLFNSIPFLALLAITFVLYYLPCLARHQITILILSSLLFYSYSEPVLVLLLLFSVGVNIICSYKVVYGKALHIKLWAIGGVATNLGILVFFKYGPLLAKTFISRPDSFGEFIITLPLPIGLSFFTFQGISLVIDVYRGKYADSKSLVPESFITHAKRILFFKSFFPQLVSGPIVKAHDFLPQISNKRIKNVEWDSVAKTLIVGYFLKMVVADNLKDFTFWISYPYFQFLSSATLTTMLFGYSCQIFADFAGYSLIAIGLARLFGYQFKDNFNFPYVSTSFREFWKRWHISLSSFLMEYLYIPLGGNQKGKLRTYFNLMIVMLLGGLWHGAAWSYAVWGGVHGLALAFERAVSTNPPKQSEYIILSILKGVFVFTFVSFAWLLFKLPDFTQAAGFIRSMFSNYNLSDHVVNITHILVYSIPVLLYHLHYVLDLRHYSLRYKPFEFIPYAAMLFLIISNSGSSGVFIYFQF